jgi:hypothetical protein
VIDENEVVQKCYTAPEDAKKCFTHVIQEIINGINKEITPINYAQDKLEIKSDEILQFVKNHQGNYTNAANILNCVTVPYSNRNVE